MKQATVDKVCDTWKMFDDDNKSFEYVMQVVMDETGLEFYTIMDALKAGGILQPVEKHND